MSNFHVIIPARYNSTRLPGKLMMDLGGKTVIERVYRQALAAEPLSVIIATDSQKLKEHAEGFGAEVILTSESHPTGTDRIAEVVHKKKFKADELIVNIQGDEPFIDPRLARQVAIILANTDAPVASLCWPISNPELFTNPNTVKVIRDKFSSALYFSRAAIPVNRDNPKSLQQVYKHIGIYAYRTDFLLEFVKWPACPLELCESIESLRVLWHGHRILVEDACCEPQLDINTYEDLVAARAIVA